MIKHTNGTVPGFAAHSPSNQTNGFGGNRRLETTEEVTATAKDQPSFEVTLSKEAQDTLAADAQGTTDTQDTDTPTQGDDTVVSFGPGKSGQSPAHLARQYWTPDSGVPFGQYVSQIAKDRDWVPPELQAEEPAADDPAIDDTAIDDTDATGGIVDDTTTGDDQTAAAGDETAPAGAVDTATDDAAAPVGDDALTDDGATAATILEAALEGTEVDEPSLVDELLDDEAETAET